MTDPTGRFVFTDDPIVNATHLNQLQTDRANGDHAIAQDALGIGIAAAYLQAAVAVGVPLGLAHGVKVVRPVAKGQSLTWDDVAMDTSTHAYQIRREMEATSVLG